MRYLLDVNVLVAGAGPITKITIVWRAGLAGLAGRVEIAC